MRFAFFVARHYLCARSRQTFISVITVMSVLGVALGVAALIVVLGVYNGFSTDIRDKILGVNAHIVITGNTSEFRNGNGMPELLNAVHRTSGVVSATPFIYAEGMLSSYKGVKGLVLRGIDPSSSSDAIAVLQHLRRGTIRELAPDHGLPGVIIGQELADKLGVTYGSRVNLLSPAGQKTASGFQPKIRPFRVSGLFHTGMYEYDTSLGFIDLDAARELMGLPDQFVTGVEVTVSDAYEADKTAALLRTVLSRPIGIRTWMDMNANLFAALKLEKIGMFILLTMVVLIGSFSIVTSLVMLVTEKTRDIAVLMAMGATRGMIRSIFMIQGTVIGLIGTLLGYVLGISVALLLQKYQFIKLPPGVYTLDHLPVLLNWADGFIIGASAMLLCFLATIYPAGKAAALQPAEALRYE